MADSKKFYLVDDDLVALEVMKRILKNAGHEVWHSSSSETALKEISALSLDCVLTDLMMPGIDGYELCQRLRKLPGQDDLKIIVVSGKGYEFDQRRARQVGADGYIVKPVDTNTFIKKIERIIHAKVKLEFWGIRGTLPVSGKETLKYGGCTSCFSLTFPDDSIFIFDAGSGIRVLGNALMQAGSRITGKIFISHSHWDHINAFPFFAPLYVRGNEFEVLGPAHGDIHMKDLIGAQMDSVYFPVTMREFGAHVTFRDLRAESFNVDDIEVSTMLLSHPGNCLGYRVTYGGKSICYITDNELFLPSSPEHNAHYVRSLVEFVQGTNILITDTTYTDEGYLSKVGWGHSCVGQVVEFAHAAGVGELDLFHHDPGDTDDDIDAKLEFAARMLQSLSSSVKVNAPADGDSRML